MRPVARSATQPPIPMVPDPIRTRSITSTRCPRPTAPSPATAKPRLLFLLLAEPHTLNTSLGPPRLFADLCPANLRARPAAEGHAPGPPSSSPASGPSLFEDNTKGIIAGDTWSFSPNLVNDFRYGYIRQGYGYSGLRKSDFDRFPLHVHDHSRDRNYASLRFR